MSCVPLCEQMSAKQSIEEKKDKTQTSYQKFLQKFTLQFTSIVDILPKDLILIIGNYLIIRPEFQIPNDNEIEMSAATRHRFLYDKCGSDFEVTFSPLQYLYKHLRLTKTKIEVVEESYPYIYISISPNLSSDWKFAIEAQGKTMDIVVTKKKSECVSYIGYDLPPQEFCDAKRVSHVGTTYISTREGPKNDVILMVGPAMQHELHVEKGTLNQYSVMVACGWSNQVIEIREINEADK
jgi:hypothetical protein